MNTTVSHLFRKVFRKADAVANATPDSAAQITGSVHNSNSNHPPDLAPANVTLCRAFVQDGFAVIPRVFSDSEIATFRAAAFAQLPQQSAPYKPQFSSTALFAEPFRRIFQNARLISSLKELLGDDFVFINEFALHDSFYSGWHTDTTSPEGKAGLDFHWRPDFCIVNIAVYLQDNLEFGGGLDVVPRSYLRDDPLSVQLRRENGFPADYRPDRAEADPYADARTIRSKAGDVVIFHTRGSHRASIPAREATNDTERKLAIFLLAAINNASSRRYREWLDQYDAMNGTKRPAVPADFQSFLAQCGHRLI